MTTNDQETGMTNTRMEDLERIAARLAADRESDLPGQLEHQLSDPIETAADRRLAAADEILRAARELRGSPDEPAGMPAIDVVKERVRDHAQALYEGDADRATEVLAEALAASAGKPPDVRQLAAEVKREMDLDAALDRFKRDYPMIASDPVLIGMADDYHTALCRAGKSEVEAVDEAGRKVLEHLRDAAGVTERAHQSEVPESDPSAVLSEMRAARDWR